MYLNAFLRGSTFYVRTVDGNYKFNPSVNLFQSTKEQSPYKSIHERPLEKREFSNVREAKKFLNEYKDILDIHGQDNFLYQIIHEQYSHTDQPSVKDIRVHAIDIEVDVPTGAGFPKPDEAKFPINAITVSDSITNKIVSFGLGHWNKDDAIQRNELTQEIADRVIYKNCVNENDLLLSYLAFIKENQPHVITGWNSDSFDMIYIYTRLCVLFSEDTAKKLSPWGMVDVIDVKGLYGKTHKEVDIKGIALLDYLKLYKKFTFKTRDSYKLDAIAHVELEKRKLSYDEEKSLFTLAQNNFQKFISYNILDAILVDELDEKLKLLPLVFDIAWKAKINFEDVLSPVKTWDALCCNELIENNVVPPLSKPPGTNEKYEGGFVKEPISGLYEDIFSFDLESLYPSIIIQWNIGFDTIVETDERQNIIQDIINENVKSDDYSLTANGIRYRNDHQSFLAKLMESLKVDRKKAKKKMFEYANAKDYFMQSTYHTKQLALKVLLNSGYGALASVYFRFFDIRMAESITMTGQAVIQYIAKHINNFMNVANKTKNIDYNNYCDTDSVYFTAGNIMKKYRGTPEYVDKMDKLCKGIEKNIITPSFDKLKNDLGCYKQQMFMDREVIADRGFWTAKKRYALRVLDNEGVRYDEPSYKTMGLSLVQSRTPEWVRSKLLDGIKIILQSDDENRVAEYIDCVKKEFISLPLEETAFNVKVGDIAKYSTKEKPYYKGGTQAQLKAVILHNKMVEKYPDIPKLNTGESVKWLWLQPNPTGEEVIAFDTFLPKEFDLENYVCYNTQFEKTFQTPLMDICKAINIKYENVFELDGFFS